MKKTVLLALAGVLAITTAGAVEVPSLYTAQVSIDDTEPDARALAYDTALAQVVLRVSGAELVNDVVLFDQLFPDPTAYVVQYRPGPADTLFVSFDGKAIENTLKRAGQRVWGGDRPLTMVWLAVDWGQGDRDIVASAEPGEQSGEQAGEEVNIDRNRTLRDRLLEVADRRGLPIAFPLLDGEDMAAVSFSDIWGGFNERVLEASRRYGVNSVLIGRVRGDGGSRNRWTYFFGAQPREWEGRPETVIAQISEMLATEFAIGGDEPLRVVNLNVTGVNGVEAFGEVYRKLADSNLVENFTISEVVADRVSFRVSVHGGAGRLARALRFAGLIEQDRIDMSDFGIDEPTSSLDFFFNP